MWMYSRVRKEKKYKELADKFLIRDNNINYFRLNNSNNTVIKIDIIVLFKKLY